MTDNEMLKRIERKVIRQTALLYLGIFIASVAVLVGLVVLVVNYDIYVLIGLAVMFSLIAMYQLCYMLAEYRLEQEKAKFFDNSEE